MASTEAEEPSQPLKSNKTCVLKVSIHCEGCKRKVKKILQSLPGVHDIDIETKLQRVVVTGDVSPETLIKKLVKAGKHAELWPEIFGKKPGNVNPPDTNDRKIEKAPSDQVNDVVSEESAGIGKEIKPPTTKTGIRTQDSSKNSHKAVAGAGGVQVSGGGGDGKVDGGAGKSEVAGKGGKVAVDVKVEEKKPETGSAGSQVSQSVVEKKEEPIEKNSGDIGGGAGGGEAKKKKKKKGQASSAAPPPVIGGSPNHSGGSPPPASVPSNQSPPRDHWYQYPPPHYYTPPPAPAPLYAVSYNTAHPPVNSYTASYYATPPPYLYAYSHSGSETEPPPRPHRPLDFGSYGQQPSDSFEMFSDENPNGCLVM